MMCNPKNNSSTESINKKNLIKKASIRLIKNTFVLHRTLKHHKPNSNQMKNTIKTIAVLLLGLTVISSIHSCKKETDATGTDKELYEMIFVTSGVYWYKNSSSLFNKSEGSGHPQPFLRTRYNSIAATKLDSNGKIMTGAKFPEGSLIVKELYDNQTTLGRYAILYKNSGSADADAKGWVWGYLSADGKVAEAASNKGTSCIGCHSQADNIDYMLMNKYFP